MPHSYKSGHAKPYFIGETVAAIFMVQDHHATRLAEKPIGIQHSHIPHPIFSLHVHLNERDCLEIVVLRGRAGEIIKVGENILSMKGVKFERINLAAAE
ncbi:MAG: hypothetical protein JSU70_07795 [Phycisphaerales bacterium]|nr:MAG: hypothetical protein JSU70_07795 [Phycisphaerales bacterium]